MKKNILIQKQHMFVFRHFFNEKITKSIAEKCFFSFFFATTTTTKKGPKNEKKDFLIQNCDKTTGVCVASLFHPKTHQKKVGKRTELNPNHV
jgi:hypothetical protein